MSVHNWSSRHRNVQGSNRASQITMLTDDQTQSACRICDRVFMNTPTLINHIEAHIVDDGLTAARLRQLVHQNNTSPLIGLTVPPFPMPRPFLYQRNPFYGVNTQTGFAPPPPSPPPSFHHQFPYPPPPPLQVSPYSFPVNINVNPVPGAQPHNMKRSCTNDPMVVREEYNTTSDCTRPFLSLLERPLPPVNYGLNDNVRNTNSDNLDLSLRL